MTLRSLKGMVLLVIGIALMSVGAAQAQSEMTLTPVKDNTLYQDMTGGISNGSGEHLFAGAVGGGGGGSLRRALVAFDIAGSLPAGATIESARLTLNMTRTTSGEQSVAIHRVLADWGEGGSEASGNEGQGAAAAAGDATWVHRFFDTMTWTNEGGDFESGASAMVSVGGSGTYTWESAQLVQDVQHWLDQPSDNFGWILIGNEASMGTAKRFDSREGATRPQLQLTFSVPTAVEDTPVPTLLRLGGNYPNPFTEQTIITYEIGAPGPVRLEVFDLLGRSVTTLVDAQQGVGSHSATFTANDLPAGLYIYRLSANGRKQHRLMTLQR